MKIILMLVKFTMEISRERVVSDIYLEIYMKVSFQIIKNKGMANIHIRMGLYIKGNGIRIENMEEELSLILVIKKLLLSFSKEK